MKKHALALALVAATPAIALADGPTLYGSLNLTLDQVETDNAAPTADTKVWQVNSNSSRIGVKGDAETGIQGLKAVYLAEFGVKADDGNNVFSARNIYAGLKGDFGSVLVGNIDTPLKNAQGSFDQFNDYAADIGKLLPGETRAANAVAYVSPKLADAVTLSVAIVPAEGADIDGAAGGEDGIADIVSASAVYQQGAIYAALALDRNAPVSPATDTFADADLVTAGTQRFGDITRAVVKYTADAFEVGALFQTADDIVSGSKGSDQALVVNGAYKIDKWKLKAQLGTSEGDVNGTEKTLTAIGADYALGKSTTLAGYYVDLASETGAGVETGVTTLGFGINQKF